MLRALWYFFQLSVVVCAILWIAAQKGAVQVEWKDYSVSTNLGIFLLGLTAVILIALTAFRLIGALIAAPGNMSRRTREKNRQKGFQALTRGFVAVAAGDAKKATSLARDVRRLLPDETGLPLLLEAQAARLRGEESAARNSFEELLSDKDAAFFGIRGLLKSSLDEGDAIRALTYARSAMEKHPKQPWILKAVYDLELRSHHWHAAMAMLPRVRKFGAIEEFQARKDEVTLLMILAEEEKIAGNEAGWVKKIEQAAKIDPAFVPAIVKLGAYYLEHGKQGKTASLVERVWRVNPHPELAKLWERLAPEGGFDPLKKLRWMEKLTVFKPDNAESQIAAGKAAMQAGLSGEAKAYLTVAENLRASAQVYRLRAELEEKTTRSASAMREWMDKAAGASPDSVWHCTLTGHIYERWHPVAMPHGAFNTIQWGSPLTRAYAHNGLAEWKDPLMIETI